MPRRHLRKAAKPFKSRTKMGLYVCATRLDMLPGRGDADARRKEYTQHLVEHLDALLAELAAERQRFAAPQPPGTPGGDVSERGLDKGRGRRGPRTKDAFDTPLAAEWVSVNIARMCSECVLAIRVVAASHERHFTFYCLCAKCSSHLRA